MTNCEKALCWIALAMSGYLDYAPDSEKCSACDAHLPCNPSYADIMLQMEAKDNAE